jgi:hypothetical protein
MSPPGELWNFSGVGRMCAPWRCRAEPAVAADRAGITALRGISSFPPALLLNCVVRPGVIVVFSEIAAWLDT